MKIKEFEQLLKKIDGRLSVRAGAVDDMNGVWFMNSYLFGIPANEIPRETDQNYKSAEGLVHRSVEQALAMAKAELIAMQNDPDLRELMVEDEKSFGERMKK